MLVCWVRRWRSNSKIFFFNYNKLRFYWLESTSRVRFVVQFKQDQNIICLSLSLFTTIQISSHWEGNCASLMQSNNIFFFKLTRCNFLKCATLDRDVKDARWLTPSTPPSFALVKKNNVFLPNQARESLDLRVIVLYNPAILIIEPCCMHTDRYSCCKRFWRKSLLLALQVGVADPRPERRYLTTCVLNL